MTTIPLAGQLASALQKHLVFSLLEMEDLAALAKELEMVSVAMGESILQEGEPADCAYLVYSGKVRVFKEGPAGKPIALATLAAGDLFGEHALLEDAARSASVRAAEDGVLCRIPRAVFAKLLHDHPSLASYLERLLRQRALQRFLQMATVLGAVPARQVVALLDQLEECIFQSGQAVCREGEPGDRLYIIQAGEAKVVKGGPGEEAVLSYLGPGDYFGERALVLHEPRYASVVALTDLSCFSLKRDNFERLHLAAPQLQEQLARRLEQYPVAEELARKFGAQPPARRAADSYPRELVWEKLEGEEALPRPPVPRPRRRSWLGFKKSFPFVPQEDESDCGAACLAMIGCYHSVPLSVERLRDLAHVGPEGASMLGLTQAADAVGFQWRAVNTDYEHVAGLSLPAVAHWRGSHYVVLVAVHGDKVVLGDPARGLVKMSRREFQEGWTGGLLLLTPTSDLQRQAPARGGWQCLQPSLTPYRGALLGVMLLSALVAGIQIAFPVLTQLLVDRVLRHGGPSPPFLWIGALLLAGMSLSAACWLRLHVLQRFLNHLHCRLTADWFERLLTLPWRYFHSRPIGRLLGRLEGGREIERLLALRTLTTVLDLLFLLPGLGLIFSYNLTLGVITLASLALLAIPILVPVRDQLRPAVLQEASARSVWVEAIQAIVALKDATAEAEMVQRHRALLSEPVLGASESRPGSRIVAFTAAVPVVAGVCSLWYGAHLVLHGQLTVGQLVAVQSLLGSMAVPVLALGGLWPDVVQFRRFLGDLADCEAVVPEQDPAKPLPALPRMRGHVRFQGVSFRHRPESRNVLAHVNLELQPGQILWLVGRSGAGKTTLAMLCQRLLLPTEGRITMDGFDLAGVELRSLRAQVSVIAEEPTLVQGTVRENIALAAPGEALERVIGAAKLASAHDFIMRFPLGYDTVLGAGGVRLSRGQRQCLCIARALLKSPRVLILDEATAALDLETERAVLKNLRWLGSDRTTMICTRRPSAVHPGDLVAVLEDGQIVEQGMPGELLKQNGLYSHLAAQQMRV